MGMAPKPTLHTGSKGLAGLSGLLPANVRGKVGRESKSRGHGVDAASNPEKTGPSLALRMSYPLVQNGKMKSMRTAQKTTRPEATLEWGRGGCVGPKKTGAGLDAIREGEFVNQKQGHVLM